MMLLLMMNSAGAMSEGERYEWPFDESPLKTRWRADVDEECSARHVACRTLRRGFLIEEETRRWKSVQVSLCGNDYPAPVGMHRLSCTVTVMTCQ